MSNDLSQRKNIRLKGYESYSSKEISAGLELEQLMQTSLKKIIKQAKPDAEMRPAEEPGAIIPHAGILRGCRQVTACSTLTRTDSALPCIHARVS